MRPAELLHQSEVTVELIFCTLRKSLTLKLINEGGVQIIYKYVPQRKQWRL